MCLEKAIELKGVGKSYGGFALRDISFDLPSGSILGLVGENGAGKTTIIKLIMNAIRRDSGSIRVLGQDNQQPDFARLKQDIGVVLDEAYFPNVLTPRQVERVMRHTYINWDKGQFFDYLRRFALPLDKSFMEFSRGMKMKLAIAVALSHSPRLLILDEATSGLDPMVREEILDIFNDFTRSEEHSVLLSSHIVSDLEKICDYIAFVHQGQLLFCEEKDLLLDEYALVNLGHGDFEALPEEAVLGCRQTQFGVKALVRKHEIASAFVTEHTNLEDIILFLAKGEKR